MAKIQAHKTPSLEKIFTGRGNRPTHVTKRTLTTTIFALLSLTAVVRADLFRTQSIQLQKGWNAIHLEVEPTNISPNSVFAGVAVDKVAGFLASAGTAQFVTDSSVNMQNLSGWGLWYPQSNPESFLNTLHAMSAGGCYLVHALVDTTVNIKGKITMASVAWKPDSFNLVGFSVLDQGAPTFAQFFAGSKAHEGAKIYRLLANGSWRKVLDPTAETLRAGESFWIYCAGSSSYQGPVRAKATTLEGMNVREVPSSLELFNESPNPVALTLEHVPGIAPVAPLSIVVMTIHDERPMIRQEGIDIPEGVWSQPLPPIQSGRSIGIPLACRREAMTVAEQSSSLRLTTDLGTIIWVPVTCIRSDLAKP